MNRFVAMEEGIGASKLELLCFKALHFPIFKKSAILASLIEKIKIRKVF